MISEQEIRLKAIREGVSPRIVEKDYYIGLLLWAISKSKDNIHFIFKGGTALRKCYIKEYRFSEDIDFTVTNRAYNDHTALTKFVKEICGRSNRTFGSNLRFFNITQEREVYGQESYKSAVHYEGLEGEGKINIDFTFYEKVELNPYSKQIKHDYSDKSDFGRAAIKVYRLEEIVAEKLRAVSYIRHYPRNRDIYDIWYLSKFKTLNKNKIANLFLKKCNFKKIDPKLIHEITNSYFKRFSKSWQSHLRHQIKILPEFSKVEKVLIPFVKTIAYLFKIIPHLKSNVPIIDKKLVKK